MAIRTFDRRFVVVVAAALLVCAHANALRADPLLISDLRFLSASVAAPWVTDTRVPDAPFAPFTATASMERPVADGTAAAVAFQTSIVTPTHISGSGLLQASGPCCGLYSAANSALNIVFELDQPFRYVFSGLLTSDYGFVELVTGFGGEFGFGERGALSATGILPAGRHEFIMEGYVESSASARYDVDLRLTPTPEPATMLLVGAALAGLVFRRRSS